MCPVRLPAAHHHHHHSTHPTTPFMRHTHHVLQVLDLSRAASAGDMRPSRLAVMVGAGRAFIRRFFELNPLGQLGLVVLRNGIAEKLTDLSGSPEAQIAQLTQYGMDAGGLMRGCGGWCREGAPCGSGRRVVTARQGGMLVCCGVCVCVYTGARCRNGWCLPSSSSCCCQGTHMHAPHLLPLACTHTLPPLPPWPPSRW